MDKSNLLGAVCAFIACLFPVTGWAVTIDINNNLIFEFNTLEFVGTFPTPINDQYGVSVTYNGDYIERGDIVRIEIFEDSLSDLPLFTHETIGTSTPIGQVSSTIIGSAWQDFQGVLRLTALSGSANVASLRFKTIIDNDEYSKTFDVSTWVPIPPVNNIPIPAAIWLFGSGLLGLIGIARRKKA